MDGAKGLKASRAHVKAAECAEKVPFSRLTREDDSAQAHCRASQPCAEKI